MVKHSISLFDYEIHPLAAFHPDGHLLVPSCGRTRLPGQTALLYGKVPNCSFGGDVSDLFATIILGIVEGITEFLPISSTGHLLIAEHWLGSRSETFNVVIQAGAILAVTVIFWQRLLSLAIGWRVPGNRTYLFKLIFAFLITAILGLGVKELGFRLPDTITPIAWALMIGGIWMFVAEWLASRQPDNAFVTWFVAVVVGVMQIVAGVFPGTSRSATTIFGAMVAGTTHRPAATEFSFLVGIPTMYAASGFELVNRMRHASAQEDWMQLTIGFVVAGVTAFIVVKWLLTYIQTHKFTGFAVYRIVLGAVLLAMIANGLAV
jgi:undecaprenyl-diphosphatase